MNWLVTTESVSGLKVGQLVPAGKLGSAKQAALAGAGARARPPVRVESPSKAERVMVFIDGAVVDEKATGRLRIKN
jgi:hypothetical protein